MSVKETEARLGRLSGQSLEAREYVEAETKNVEWYAFKRGDKAGANPIRGTKAELLKTNG